MENVVSKEKLIEKWVAKYEIQKGRFGIHAAVSLEVNESSNVHFECKFPLQNESNKKFSTTNIFCHFLSQQTEQL